MKAASIYERLGKWYFRSRSTTTTGLWMGTPPLVEIDCSASRQQKYDAAMEVLNASQQGVSIPEDAQTVIAPFLEKAGVNSWAKFMRRAKSVSLELENERLTIMPFKKLRRPAGASEGIPERAITISANAPPEEIGAALEEAMKCCQ